MGTMEWDSPHPLPALSANANDVADQNKNVNIEPKTSVTAVDGDRLFRARPSVNNTSYSSSTDDDSSHATITGASPFNNDSDCETIDASLSTSRNENLMNEAILSSDIDKLFIEELKGLSVADRGMVQEEIHGVSTCAVSEDDEKIVNGLKCLEEEIRTIRREVLLSPDQVSKAGNSYSASIWNYLAVDEEQSSSSTSVISQKRDLYSYIFHREFRLKFLRADLYDVKKASHRYLRCVECLLRYFGSYALQRPLMYEDLGKECQDLVKAGYGQILPSRDRAGRLVVVNQSSIEVSMAMIVKTCTYIFQVVSEDVETQKRGAIFIFSTNDDALQLLSEPSAKKEYSIYREGSPVRRSCTHFCLPENNPKMTIVRAIIMMAMSREDRVRTRIHMEGKFSAISFSAFKG
jgi:hypothetical protein